MPYARTPAKVKDRTPHNMNMDSAVRTSVVDAMAHGLTISERNPAPRRPIKDAPLSIASDRAASFELNLMEEA